MRDFLREWGLILFLVALSLGAWGYLLWSWKVLG